MGPRAEQDLLSGILVVGPLQMTFSLPRSVTDEEANIPKVLSHPISSRILQKFCKQLVHNQS